MTPPCGTSEVSALVHSLELSCELNGSCDKHLQTSSQHVCAAVIT